MRPLNVIGLTLLAAAVACSDKTPQQEQPTTAQPEITATPAPQAVAPEAPPPAAPSKRPEPEPAPVGTSATFVNGKKTNADALVLSEFKERVDGYVDIHNKARKESAPIKETKDPAKITLAEADLAARIRLLRENAKQGDIFTPETADVFRRLLYPELKGKDGKAAKEILSEDEDKPKNVPLKVNAKYPEGAPLPTVPVNLLTSLPTLPKEVEYRIIGKNLILRDTTADIIVDYVPRVIR
jgi:hypothetical protein